MAGAAEPLLLEARLTPFQAKGLLHSGGRARTESTPMIAAVRTLNRLACVGDTLRAALNEVAVVAPPAGIPGALRRRYEGLLDRVSLYFPFPDGTPESDGKRFVDSFRAAA